MATFSERNGFTPVRLEQIDDLDPRTRNKLFDFANSTLGFYDGRKTAWYTDFLGKKFTEVPKDFWYVTDPFVRHLWKYFDDKSINQIFDLLEWVIDLLQEDTLELRLNDIFSEQKVGYRVILSEITRITSELEMESINIVLKTNPLAGVRWHIEKAIAHFSDREKPDYQNSIKESICAVECILREIAGGNTLGEAIKNLKNAKLQLIDKFILESWGKLYDFSNQSGGIRHGNIEGKADHGLGSEAKYFLVQCSAIVNYLADNFAEKLSSN